MLVPLAIKNDIIFDLKMTLFYYEKLRSFIMENFVIFIMKSDVILNKLRRYHSWKLCGHNLITYR